MSEVNQTPEEKNAQLEEQAEREFAEISKDTQIARDENYELGKRITEYAHSQLKHFMQVDSDLAQGVITFEGVPYICSFHRTMNDLMEDTWSMDIASVEFIGTTDILEELAHRNDYILLAEPMEPDDDDED